MSSPENTATATVCQSSTEWGSGETACFICGRTVSYSLRAGATVPSISSPDLCDRDCTTPGVHWGDCAALGGDLCPTCNHLAGHADTQLPHDCGCGGTATDAAQFAMRANAAHHRRRADELDRYAAARIEYRTPLAGARNAKENTYEAESSGEPLGEHLTGTDHTIADHPLYGDQLEDMKDPDEGPVHHVPVNCDCKPAPAGPDGRRPVAISPFPTPAATDGQDGFGLPIGPPTESIF